MPSDSTDHSSFYAAVRSHIARARTYSRLQHMDNEWDLSLPLEVEPHVCSWAYAGNSDLGHTSQSVVDGSLDTGMSSEATYEASDSTSMGDHTGARYSMGDHTVANPDAEGTLIFIAGCSQVSGIIDDFIQEDNLEADVIDVSTRAGTQEFIDEHLFEKFLTRLREQHLHGRLNGIMISHGFNTGAVRSATHPYGRPQLPPAIKEQVRKETALALHMAAMVSFAASVAMPVSIILSESNSTFSFLDLPELAEATVGFRSFTGDVNGKRHVTSSNVRAGSFVNFGELILNFYEATVYHTPGCLVESGKKKYLQERLRQVKSRTPTTSLGKGDFQVTDSSATVSADSPPTRREGVSPAPPSGAITRGAAASQDSSDEDQEDDGLKKKYDIQLSLKGTPELTAKQLQERDAIGGMRQPRYSNKKVPKHPEIGKKVAAAIEAFLDDHEHIEDMIFGSLGKSKEEANLPSSDQIRGCLDAVVNILTAELSHSSSSSASSSATSQLTQLNSHLLRLWVLASQDPDIYIVEWLDSGAPAGISRHAEDAGIFPVASDSDAAQARVLQEFHAGFRNYVSMEESDGGDHVLQDLVDKEYVIKFPSIEEAETYLGSKAIVSKLALITTEKEGIVKHRLILDCRVSGSNDHTRKSERILLPRAWHVIKDALQLAAMKKDEEEITFAVCDFTDAFYMIPLHRDEQRYFVASHKGCIYVWRRIAQGSLNGPNVFGRLSALVGRCTQACFDPAELRLHIYSDDPIAVMRATPQRRRRLVGVLIMIWLLMNFSLAAHKAQEGPSVLWIGYQLTCDQEKIHVAIKEAFMEELFISTKTHIKGNVISIKNLRKFAGQANHVAGLLYGWRPFLESFWAALADAERKAKRKKSHAPRQMVWTKQVRIALQWILDFLSSRAGSLSRQWFFLSYMSPDINLIMALDASPYGIGGVLIKDGTIITYFADGITTHDSRIFGFERGDDKGQQIWESLCLLVALKTWAHEWMHRRIVLQMKSDNTGALTLATQLKGKGPRGILARELALLYSESSFEPRRCTHIPGVVNVGPDALSRLQDPSGTYQIPNHLLQTTRSQLQTRDETWYRTLERPRRGRGGRKRALNSFSEA